MQLEYYVYGDFRSVVNAFQMIANLFSNHTYQSWFTVVILLTVAAFAFQATAEKIFGAKVSDALWIKRVMIGTVLYSIFMVPTVTLHIYDPVKNKYEAVGGIPAGVGLIAGLTSGFTREISELIETAGNPIMNIDDIGFGHGYEMLAAISSLGSIGVVQDQNLANTIKDYFVNCVDQMQVHGDLDVNGMWNGNDKDLLENILTDYKIFSSTIYRGTSEDIVYCAEASGYINTELRKTDRIDAAFRVFCSRMNYDPLDTQEYLMCRQKFRGVYQAFGSTNTVGYNETNLFASAVIAQMYLADGINGGAERAKEIARSMANASDVVSGAMAADFMPMIQGMVATILISLFVIVALLMYVAPMDAFKFYFGLWIWFLTWVLVDVVINIQVQNYAYNVFREIRETGLSLTTMFTIGDSSAQILGWYGKARWMSMTIASMMTYGIFKFGGGAAFASFAGALGASYSGQAASQGAQVGAPGGEAAQYKKTADDLAGVKAVTVGAGVNPRQYIQAVENTSMANIGSQVRYGEDIGTEAGKNFGGSAYEVGSMIGSSKAYNDIKNGHVATDLMARGYDSQRQAAAETFNTAGTIGAAEKTRAVEQSEDLDYAQTLSEGGLDRNLRFFTDANFRQREAERTGNSLMDTYQSEANFRKAVNENGYENIAVDLNGNVVAREGFYSKMRVDTDQNGVGMEMTNVKYNTATGDLEGMYNGKVYKMQGEFLDGDGKDGMISIKPVDTEWRATYQKLNVDGQELTGVQARGFALHSESSMKIEGSAMIGGEMKKITAFGQGDIKQGEHGAYTTGSFSILDADSSKMNTHKEGVTKTYDNVHSLNIDGQTRTMSGKLTQSGDTFTGENLIDKETGMSYVVKATGSRGSDGVFNLNSSFIKGEGTMDTLTASEGTVLKGAKVNVYGGNFDNMRMEIQGTTMVNGKAMEVSAKAQGRIKNGQVIGDFSIMDKDASEMTRVKEGTDKQRLDVDKDVYDHQDQFTTGYRNEHAETVTIAGTATGNADPRMFKGLAEAKGETNQMHHALMLANAYASNYTGYDLSDSLTHSKALAFIGSLGADVSGGVGGSGSVGTVGNKIKDFFAKKTESTPKIPLTDNPFVMDGVNPKNTDNYGYRDIFRNPSSSKPDTSGNNPLEHAEKGTPQAGSSFKASVGANVKAGGLLQNKDETTQSQQEQYNIVSMSYGYAAFDATKKADELGLAGDSKQMFIKSRMDEFDAKFREEFTGVKSSREIPTEIPSMPSGNENSRIHDTKPEDIYGATTTGTYFKFKEEKKNN